MYVCRVRGANSWVYAWELGVGTGSREDGLRNCIKKTPIIFKIERLYLTMERKKQQ